jgi:hypothetical protein
MTLGNDMTVWESYATEFALAFGDGPTRVRAVRAAYLSHGFDVEMITELSGLPAWRVRQAILGSNPRPPVD